MRFNIQSRSNKVDFFAAIDDPDTNYVKEHRALMATPLSFVEGKPSTDPNHALMTLSVKEARGLANKILRAVGKEGS